MERLKKLVATPRLAMVKIFGIDEKTWRSSSGRVTVLLDESMSGRLMAGILVLEPGQRLPAEGFSQHSESDELAYVVEGSAIFGGEDGEILMRGSDLVFNPRGTRHYVRNAGDKPCKMIWFLAPPIRL
ncbi:MAG: cupin domain-containing protein [Nitrososphaerota archaeon]